MSSSSLSPRSKMATLAQSVAAAASASAKKQRATPKRKNAVKLSRSVAKESPLRRKSAVRVRRASQTQKYQQALANFLSTSQPGNRLSRTTSTRSVSKSNVRRRSLPDLSQRGKSPTGTPKGNLANAAIEKLITGASDKQRVALFKALTEHKLKKAREVKLPRQNLADPRAVKKLEEEQRKAREARAKRVAATEAKRLNENEAELKKLADGLKELKKKHHDKTSRGLDLESTFRPFILKLPQLVPSDKKESEMTAAEKAYKKKYEELNKGIQAMVKQLQESKKAITEREASLESKKEDGKPLTALEARRKLEQLEQERKAQAAAEVEKSQAAKTKREQVVVAAQKAADRRHSMLMRSASNRNLGEGPSTSFGKKRSKKEAKKTKTTRGASKKKVGGYPSSSKPNNYGSYP